MQFISVVAKLNFQLLKVRELRIIFFGAIYWSGA